ncbi:Hypothetical protein NTJ_11800 [Nesidiocoris tenuis]|uniref:Uncharacterized protein n=1 Tax=Nesidiocoris tenuis TaxID=355587 RepID=A0ABN7B5X3_9HEMI|nr:Hypothetical protein NTJ_11800 [Nesidiocoris tenuis]
MHYRLGPVKVFSLILGHWLLYTIIPFLFALTNSNSLILAFALKTQARLLNEKLSEETTKAGEPNLEFSRQLLKARECLSETCEMLQSAFNWSTSFLMVANVVQTISHLSFIQWRMR